MATVQVLNPPYTSLLSAVRLPGPPAMGAALVMELGDEPVPLLLLDVAAAAPWCPVVLVSIIDRKSRSLIIAEQRAPYPTAWTPHIHAGRGASITAATVLDLIRHRPEPNPFLIGSYVAARLRQQEVGRMVQTACSAEAATPGALAVSDRELRRRLLKAGLPAPGIWRRVGRLAAFIAQCGTNAPRTAKEVAIHYQIDPRTAVGWIEDVGGSSDVAILQRESWEGLIEPLLRQAPALRLESEAARKIAWHQAQAAIHADTAVRLITACGSQLPPTARSNSASSPSDSQIR